MDTTTYAIRDALRTVATQADVQRIDRRLNVIERKIDSARANTDMRNHVNDNLFLFACWAFFLLAWLWV